MNSKRQQAGMSLLETLVAIVVFSVGVTGVASLMLTSMRNNDATRLVAGGFSQGELAGQFRRERVCRHHPRL